MPILGNTASGGKKPSTPVIGTATAGSGSATVAYTASTYAGKTGTAVYTATSSPGGFTGTGASPITVSGLNNGTAYTFTVRASTSYGVSSDSSAASNSVTPSVPSFITSTGQGSIDYSATGGTIDSSSNVYNSNQWGFMKYSSSGSNLLQKKASTDIIGFAGIGADASGNVYTYGNSSTSGSSRPTITKWNSSGSITSSFYNTLDTYPKGIKVDPATGNVYTMGSYSTAYGSALFLKFNSSLNLVNSFYWGGSKSNFTSQYKEAMTWDSSGNMYFGGHYGNNTGYAYLLKSDSTGAQQLAVGYRNTSVNNELHALKFGADGYLYAIMVTAYNDNQMMKLDPSNGNIIWQRRLTYAGGAYGGANFSLDIDSSGNVYMAYSQTIGIAIAKWNSSGTLLWNRDIAVSGGIVTIDGSQIVISGNDYFIFSRTRTVSGGLGSPVTFRLPTDGSKTGSYSNNGNTYSYSVGSGAESAGTINATYPALGSYTSLSTGSTSATAATVTDTSFTTTVTSF